MKAIRVSAYGGPEVLKLEEVPTLKPGAGQVLVRNHAVGVNPVDTYLRSNTDNRGPKLPYTPGSDAAGVVEAVGSDVTGVKAGDRVYVGGTATGAYAELWLCAPAQVHALAGQVSFAQGAAVNVPYATAYHALFNRGHGDAGETVLVHGASGGVGIGAVQLARARGLTVIGTAGTERGRRLVLRAGRPPRPRPLGAGLSRRADAPHGQPRRGHRPRDARQRQSAEGPRHHRHARPHRRHRQSRHDRDQCPARDEQGRRHPRHVARPRLTGPARGHPRRPRRRARNGTLRPVIAQELPLAQASRAHEAVMEPGHHGKVVMIP